MSASQTSSDICAYFSNFDFASAFNAVLTNPVVDSFAPSTICLCYDDTDDFIVNNPAAAAALSANDEDSVTNAIAAQPDYEECTYPRHSTPVCSQSNVCGYTCNLSGYVPCNGACVNTGCPSSGLSKKRSEQLRLKGYTCPVGWTKCGGWTSELSHECVDIQNALDSCGGCAFGLRGAPSTGVDCSAIPGVNDVACVKGKCSVTSCQGGWTINQNSDSCDLD